MNRQTVASVIVVLAVLLTAGTLVASNMAFKLNYPLRGPTPGVSKTGTNTLTLPDLRKQGLNTAKNLMDSIGFASVQSVQRFVTATNTFLVYTGRPPNSSANNFQLMAGEAYFVRMKTSVNYIVVGADDPTLLYELPGPNPAGAVAGPPVSLTGLTLFAWQYNSTSVTAKQLMDDIGFASVQSVARFIASTDTYLVYTGRSPQQPSLNFPLVPGEGYLIRMNTTTLFDPDYY